MLSAPSRNSAEGALLAQSDDELRLPVRLFQYAQECPVRVRDASDSSHQPVAIWTTDRIARAYDRFAVKRDVRLALIAAHLKARNIFRVEH